MPRQSQDTHQSRQNCQNKQIQMVATSFLLEGKQQKFRN
jgi:hypothetical protein